MKLICLPQHLTELVLGRLLTEHSSVPSMTSSRSISANMENAPKSISSHPKPEFRAICVVFCGNYADLLHRKPYPQRLFFLRPSTGSVTPRIEWKPEWIFHMADTFADGMPLHSVTFATHAVFSPEKMRFYFPVKTSVSTTPLTR